MSVINGVLLIAAVAVGTTGCRPAAGAASERRPATSAAQPAATQTEGSRNQEINDGFVRQVAERIAGRENEPAEEVFENIQWLKGVSAGRFLRIMDVGYARGLGVTCTHCHVEDDFASDDKRPKRAAREMAAMHRMINERLRDMKNLASGAARAINCSTCHRGAIDPLAPRR